MPKLVTCEVRSRAQVVRREFAAQHRHGLTTDLDAVTYQTKSQLAAARRGLKRHQLFLAELRAPVRRERAMGRSRHRIFRHARLRCEEARDEVVFALAVAP